MTHIIHAKHEAHRHPYIDTLSVIYLYKLRYGENFGKRAGSTWRLLFVHALMPWLSKYRIIDQDKEAMDRAEAETSTQPENNDEEDSANVNVKPSLMTRFQSLRSFHEASFNEGQPAPVTPVGGSIVEETGNEEEAEMLELKNSELEAKVAALQSQVIELEERVKILSRN